MKVVSEPQLDFLVNGGFCLRLRFRFRFFALAKLVKKLEYSDDCYANITRICCKGVGDNPCKMEKWSDLQYLLAFCVRLNKPFLNFARDMAINNSVVELWLHSLSILSKLICARLHKPWPLAIGFSTKTITMND